MSPEVTLNCVPLSSMMAYIARAPLSFLQKREGVLWGFGFSCQGHPAGVLTSVSVTPLLKRPRPPGVSIGERDHNMLRGFKALDRVLRGEATRIPDLKAGTVDIP